MFGDPAVYRRRQRRRAIIAWATGALAVLLFVLAVVLGGSGDKQEEKQPPNPFGYAMTSAQFDDLRYGLSQSAFVDRLEETGLPESQIKGRYAKLFPSHTDAVTCSYWEISDALEEVARVCFDSGGKLVEKLRRDAGQEAFGVST